MTALIFENFKSREDAKKFAAMVKHIFPIIRVSVYGSQADACFKSVHDRLVADPFAKGVKVENSDVLKLTAPIALVERPYSSDAGTIEQYIESMAEKYGGEFFGTD